MILVVDNEPATAKSVQSVLQFNGFDARVAFSCDEALALIHHEQPVLIFCDITMPGRSGLDLLHCLRADTHTNHIPFVFLSALARDADVQHGLTAGADGYLTKPFSMTELLAAVQALIPNQASA